MFQDVKKHKVAYSLLALAAASFLCAIYLFRNNTFILMITAVSFAVIYLIWGIIHHLTEHNLTGKIMLEYALVTALGLIIMSTLLL